MEACNKLIRKYREHLARKISFTANCKDIFVSLLSQSDPILQKYIPLLQCKECGEIGHTCRLKCGNRQSFPNEQDI